MSLIPDIYRPPLGLPLNWRDDLTGQMSAAVIAYFDRRPTPRQLELLRDYFRHHIHAPCWLETHPVPMEEAGEEYKAAIENLRAQADKIATVQDISDYIYAALAWGLDPL